MIFKRIILISLLGFLVACGSSTQSDDIAQATAGGDSNKDCDKPLSPCVQELVRTQVEQELARAMAKMTQDERRVFEKVIEKSRETGESIKSPTKTSQVVQKKALSALDYHVGRHKQTCACKSLQGVAKADCLKNVKLWELAHTIKKTAKKPSAAELKARGLKIQEALGKIPCGGPQ